MPRPVSKERSSSRSPVIGAPVDDFSVERSRRIGSLGLFTAVVLGVVLVARETSVGPGEPSALAIPVRWILLPLAIALSLALFWMARRRAIAPERLEQLGLVYYVVVAAAIAVLVNEFPWPTELTLPSWSPVAVWVVVYPFMVPMSPAVMTAAAAIAAATDPLALLVTQGMTEAGLPSTSLMLSRFFPNGVAILLAFLESRRLAGLDRRLTEARALGSYQLVEKLGRGGMGEVWRAKHRLLARPAAIKLIRPDALDERDPAQARVLLKRFEREVQATAELRSPHTVQIYDFGISRDHTFYYAMELLHGLDLHRLVLKHGPQPISRTIFLVRQACHSLHEAHLRGLVHRDVKPANIFACRYGSDLDFVKVLDFGLVKRDPLDGRSLTQLTTQGSAPGSPAFMPPEVARGESQIDGRADIYALGCLLYWLLTGRIVFEAPTAMRMMTLHASAAPEPPSARTERTLPEALESVVMACLEKKPDNRPQTAADLAELLADLQLEDDWTEAKRIQWWATHDPRTRSDPVAAKVLAQFETLTL